MKTTILAIAATILVVVPNVASAQDAPPEELIIIPGDQEPPQPEKKKRKEKAEEQKNQDAEQPAQAEQGQVPEPAVPEKKKRKQKAEEQNNQGEQPEQVQQEAAPEPVIEQPVEPVKKKRKLKAEEQNNQPEQIEQGAAPEPVIEQPEKKKRKQKAEEQKEQGGDQPAQIEQPKQEENAAGMPADAAEFLADRRIAGDLTDAELKARISKGRDLARNENIPREQRQQAQAMSKQATAELLRRQQQANAEQTQQPVEPVEPVEPKADDQTAAVEQPQPEQPKTQAEQQQAKELDGNQASPEAEAKAKEFLQGQRSAEQMNDEELRQRLESMRELLGSNQLSRESERALRRQLRAERDILRTRVASKVEAEEKAKQQQEQQAQGQDTGNKGKQGRDRGDRRRWDDWAADDVLRDRRDSGELEEGELRRRIDIYRDAVNDDRYDEGNRRYWRESMGRDRRALRGRMIEDRRDRAADYRRRRDRGDTEFDIDINIDLDEDRPDSVFADEADDEELEEQLASAPRQKINRRYTVQEIEEDPEIRVAMPAIEIDTVRFGFNEAFVREEEVESLDRIAEVIEKILAVHPGEVFMIEGHTDAVGSDGYNLNLSRQRSQAVKEALATFYVIPTRNLETVGYGERYLKIPTAEPEQENRRVTLRRVTPLVGEALED